MSQTTMDQISGTPLSIFSFFKQKAREKRKEACGLRGKQNPPNLCVRVLARYESHLACFNLRDSTTSLTNLCLRDLCRNAMGKTLHNAVNESCSFLRRKLLCHLENLCNLKGCSPSSNAIN